jgi:hypothetical protein
MKGFVITLDSIIAIIISMSMLVLLNSQFLRTNSSAWSDAQVRRLSMDSLTILEKSGALARTVELNSSSELLYFMSSEFPSLCMKIRIDGTGGYTLSAAKAGCSTEGRFFISRRSFVSGDVFYIAELHTWEK